MTVLTGGMGFDWWLPLGFGVSWMFGSKWAGLQSILVFVGSTLKINCALISGLEVLLPLVCVGNVADCSV